MTIESKFQFGRVVFNRTHDLQPLENGVDGISNDVCSFTFSQIPDSAANLAQGFTPRSMKSKGLTFLSAQKIRTSVGECDSVRFRQTHEGQSFNKWAIFIPDNGGTQLFFATFAPGVPTELETRLVNEIFAGIEIDNEAVEQLGVQHFRFEEVAPFKVADRRRHQVILTVDGVYPVKSDDDLVLSLSEVQIRLLPPQFEPYVRKRLESLNVKPQSSKISQIANGTYEVEAEMKAGRNQALMARYMFLKVAVIQCECFGGREELGLKKILIGNCLGSASF